MADEINYPSESASSLIVELKSSCTKGHQCDFMSSVEAMCTFCHAAQSIHLMDLELNRVLQELHQKGYAWQGSVWDTAKEVPPKYVPQTKGH